MPPPEAPPQPQAGPPPEVPGLAADLSKLIGLTGGTTLWNIIDDLGAPISTLEILDLACKHALLESDEAAKIEMLADALAANHGAMKRLGELLLHINKNELNMLSPPAAERLARFNRQLFDFLTDVHSGFYETEQDNPDGTKEIDW